MLTDNLLTSPDLSFVLSAHSIGKYVGSRPIKLRKSNWKTRNIEEVRKRQKEKDALLGKKKMIMWPSSISFVSNNRKYIVFLDFDDHQMLQL